MLARLRTRTAISEASISVAPRTRRRPVLWPAPGAVTVLSGETRAKSDVHKSGLSGGLVRRARSDLLGISEARTTCAFVAWPRLASPVPGARRIRPAGPAVR